MYRKLVLFVLCVTLVLTTAGCYAQVEKPEQSTSVPADTTPRDTTLPREPPQPQADGPHFAITHVEPFGVKANTNIRLSVAGLGKGGYPTPDGEAMYLASSTVSYFDPDSGTEFAACPIAGCTHKDDACPGRIPGLTAFCADDTYWYAFTMVEDVLRLLRVDPSTGDRTVLHTWKYGAYFGDGILSSGYILADICSFLEQDRTSSYVSIDLADGTVREFARSDEMGQGRLAGGDSNTVIMEWLTYSEPLLTFEQWLEANPGKSEEDYFTYVDRLYYQDNVVTLRSFDLTTGDYRDLPNTQGARLFSDPNISYDEYFVYRQGDSVMLGSFSGEESRTVFTADGIINAWLMDGRVFILRQDGAHLQEWVADMAGGEAKLLHDYGESDGVVFSAVREINDYFIGSGSSYISKADYYAGNFDKANSF
ncbi:MAG TPA: hypothetical protein IAB74_02950 [Candidatus Faecousia excrementigallinarum]|uniref:Uncharacterized protein n=1 Tax=Candidatus Faecousia excrementigallinarum TaxID=2840806 RepID=A0A9D0Z1A6_9FIRM|nr:hypothetical protein [Candidatus Faecousia excrementigallinarum]